MAASNNTKTLSIAEVASIIDVNPRMIRKALRANIAKDAQPGRGGSWAIRESDIDKVRAMIETHNARTQKVVDLGD